MDVDWSLIAELYKRALAIIEKLVERARQNDDFAALMSGVEDILATVKGEKPDPEMAQRALADLKKFDEALSGNDAAADRVLRDKFGGVDDPS